MPNPWTKEEQERINGIGATAMTVKDEEARESVLGDIDEAPIRGGMGTDAMRRRDEAMRAEAEAVGGQGEHSVYTPGEDPVEAERRFNEELGRGYFAAVAKRQLPELGDVDMDGFSRRAMKLLAEERGIELPPDEEMLPLEEEGAATEGDDAVSQEEAEQSVEVAKTSVELIRDSAEQIMDIVKELGDSVEELSDAPTDENLEMAEEMDAGMLPDQEEEQRPAVAAAKNISIEQLKKDWFPTKKVVEITDKEKALSFFNSKTAPAWGNKHLGNGWSVVSQPSPQHEGEQSVVYVAKTSLIKDATTAHRVKKTEYDYGYETAEYAYKYGGGESWQQPQRDMGRDIPEEDYKTMQSEGIPNPSPRAYWEGYNDFLKEKEVFADDDDDYDDDRDDTGGSTYPSMSKSERDRAIRDGRIDAARNEMSPKAVKAIRAYASMHRRIDDADFGKVCAGLGVTVEAGKKIIAGDMGFLFEKDKEGWYFTMHGAATEEFGPYDSREKAQTAMDRVKNKGKKRGDTDDDYEGPYHGQKADAGKKATAANYGKGEPNGAFYHKIKDFVKEIVADKEKAGVSWQDDKESIYSEVAGFVEDQQGVEPSMPWVKRMTDHALRNLGTVAAKVNGWTADQSDVTPGAKKIMDAFNALAKKNGWKSGSDFEKHLDEIAAAMKPFVANLTVEDVNVLDDYNKHSAIEGLCLAMGATKDGVFEVGDKVKFTPNIDEFGKTGEVVLREERTEDNASFGPGEGKYKYEVKVNDGKQITVRYPISMVKVGGGTPVKKDEDKTTASLRKDYLALTAQKMPHAEAIKVVASIYKMDEKKAEMRVKADSDLGWSEEQKPKAKELDDLQTWLRENPYPGKTAPNYEEWNKKYERMKQLMDELYETKGLTGKGKKDDDDKPEGGKKNPFEKPKTKEEKDEEAKAKAKAQRGGERNRPFRGKAEAEVLWSNGDRKITRVSDREVDLEFGLHSDRALRYDNGTIVYDRPEDVPADMKEAVRKIFKVKPTAAKSMTRQEAINYLVAGGFVNQKVADVYDTDSRVANAIRSIVGKGFEYPDYSHMTIREMINGTKTSARRSASAGVGETILQQLGGNKFLAMTGAHVQSTTENMLAVKFPKAKDGINALAVYYDEGKDTYRMRFISQKGAPTMEVKDVAVVDDVYAEDLRRIFTDHTGLETSLGTMRGQKARAENTVALDELREIQNWFSKNPIKDMPPETYAKMSEEIKAKADRMRELMADLYEETPLRQATARVAAVKAGEEVEHPRFGKVRIEHIDDKTYSIPMAVFEVIDGDLKGEKIIRPAGEFDVTAAKKPGGIDVRQSKGKWEVVDRKDNDKVLGTHDSEEKAREQQKAIYASMNAKGAANPIDIGDGYYVHKVGYDRNGNWSVWVSKGANPAMKIQTNGDAPEAHRARGKYKDLSEAVDALSDRARDELKEYHRRFGAKATKEGGDAKPPFRARREVLRRPRR